MSRYEDLRTKVPIAINVIIEGQLFVLLDVAICKDAHPNMLVYRPFRHVTVRVAAMIRKAPYATTLSSVDELRVSYRQAGHMDSYIPTTCFVFLQHHEIEMSYAFFCILTHAFEE